MAADKVSLTGGAARSAASYSQASIQAAAKGNDAQQVSSDDRSVAPPAKPSPQPAQQTESRFAEAKATTARHGGAATSKVKQRSANELKAKKPTSKQAKATFSGARATAAGHALSPQEVSDRFSQIPSDRRGSEVASLLNSGQVSPGQVASYVAGAETGQKQLHTALSRAATLLQSSLDPKLQKAVVAGLEALVEPGLSRPGEPSAKDTAAAQKLERQLGDFLQGDSAGGAGTLAVAQAIAEQAQSPALRAASALELTRRAGSLGNEIEHEKHNLEASFDPQNLQNVPGGMLKVTEYRLQTQTHIDALEHEHAQVQAALGQTVVGPKDREADLKLDPNQPQTGLGQTLNYVEKFYTHQQLPQAKEIVRALFDPPSPAAMDCVGELTARVKATDSKMDGHALGYLVEAGHQALAVDAAKAEHERSELASGALQLAVSAGLGFGGVLASAALRVAGSAKDATIGKGLDQGFRAAFTRLGQDAFNAAVRTTTSRSAAAVAQ